MVLTLTAGFFIFTFISFVIQNSITFVLLFGLYKFHAFLKEKAKATPTPVPLEAVSVASVPPAVVHAEAEVIDQ